MIFFSSFHEFVFYFASFATLEHFNELSFCLLALAHHPTAVFLNFCVEFEIYAPRVLSRVVTHEVKKIVRRAAAPVSRADLCAEFLVSVAFSLFHNV